MLHDYMVCYHVEHAFCLKAAVKEIPLITFFAPNAGTVQCFNMADQTKKICCENKDSSTKVDLIKFFYSLKMLFLTFLNFYK